MFSQNLHCHIIAMTVNEEEEGLAIALVTHEDSPVVVQNTLTVRHTDKQVQVSEFNDNILEKKLICI